MTELLTEIERFDGVCFLATNRPQDLDEAMFRRIRCVFELPAPNHVQRLQIWRRLTRAEGIALADGVELAEIAAKFEMTGGYIRNAVLGRAVGSGPSHRCFLTSFLTCCRCLPPSSLRSAASPGIPRSRRTTLLLAVASKCAAPCWARTWTRVTAAWSLPGRSTTSS